MDEAYRKHHLWAYPKLKHLPSEKPFFVYFAPGALHAPHHTPKEWIDKYKGKFDEGWDNYREATLARQKQLGVVPDTTQLAPWAPGVKHWDQLSAACATVMRGHRP